MARREDFDSDRLIGRGVVDDQIGLELPAIHAFPPTVTGKAPVGSERSSVPVGDLQRGFAHRSPKCTGYAVTTTKSRR